MSSELTEIVREQGEKIAAIAESAKSAHHRISEMAELTTSVNNLAQSVARVAEKVELITERIDRSIERIEQGQRAQGERIGGIEKAILTIGRNEKIIDEHEKRIVVIEKEILLIERNAQAIAEHEKRLDEIDKAPADKWNKFTWLIFSGIAAAVVAFFMGKFM